MTHNHHIVPRHAGGSDDPSNLIRLTIPEHAEAHKLLWETQGRLQDKYAWLMLANKTEEAEATRIELLRTPEVRAKISKARIRQQPTFLGHKHSLESRAKMSQPKSPETCAKISQGRTGLKHSPETCAKISISLRKMKCRRF